MHCNSGLLTAQTTGLQRRGSALRTEMLRPIHSTSWRSSMAFVSSASWLRSTNANHACVGVGPGASSIWSPLRIARTDAEGLPAQHPGEAMKIVKKSTRNGSDPPSHIAAEGHAVSTLDRTWPSRQCALTPIAFVSPAPKLCSSDRRSP